MPQPLTCSLTAPDAGPQLIIQVLPSTEVNHSVDGTPLLLTPVTFDASDAIYTKALAPLVRFVVCLLQTWL